MTVHRKGAKDAEEREGFSGSPQRHRGTEVFQGVATRVVRDTGTPTWVHPYRGRWYRHGGFAV